MQAVLDYVAEFRTWPDCKKVALLTGLMLPFHTLAAPIVVYAAHLSGIADAGLLAALFAAPVLILSTLFILSLLCQRAGYQGRYLAYGIVFLYGGWIAAMVSCFGLWSTPLEAWVPPVVIVCGLWFDRRIGMLGLAFALLMTVLIVAAVRYELMPYAPALINRNIDAQNSVSWIVVTLGPFLLMFVISVAMTWLMESLMQRQQHQLLRAGRLIRRYAPAQVAERIMSGEHDADFQPMRAKITVFFSDLEGFTHSSDDLDPEELAAILNEYLSEMAGIAKRYGATINQFIGDGIMLFFGAPDVTNDKDHALRAVHMALEMQRRIEVLNRSWRARGARRSFRARMGINTGYASVGDFGSNDRKTYTAIGIQTNIAARIQSQCEPGKVLMTDTTWALVREQIDCEDHGECTVRGVHFPIRIYQACDPSEHKPNRRIVPLKERTSSKRQMRA